MQQVSLVRQARTFPIRAISSTLANDLFGLTKSWHKSAPFLRVKSLQNRKPNMQASILRPLGGTLFMQKRSDSHTKSLL